MNKAAKNYLVLGDALLEEVARIFNLTWNNEDMMIHDAEDKALEWDEEISYPFNHGDIIQINFWGDGTLEFQTTDGESTNWADFDKEVLVEIINQLKLINNN